MKSSVRAARIERGNYLADLKRETAIHVIADARAREMEAEIEQLNEKLNQFQQNAKTETALIVEKESRARAETAYQEGFNAGKVEGNKEGRAAVQEAVEIVRKLAIEIEQSLDIMWKECRDHAVELTMIIARKVVGTIADEYDELARQLAAKCMTFARDQIKVKILVNPQDAETVRQAEAELMSLAEGVKEIEIAERASVSRGGVVIETDSGQIDARLEEQLDAVIAALKPGWSAPDQNGRNRNEKDEKF